MASIGGRAPPGQDAPMPSAGSRSPGGARGPPAPAPRCDPGPRPQARPACRCHARPAAPIAAASPPRGRSWRRSSRPPPVAGHAPRRRPAPGAQPAPGPRAGSPPPSPSPSSPRPRNGWSLRQTRRGLRFPTSNRPPNQGLSVRRCCSKACRKAVRRRIGRRVGRSPARGQARCRRLAGSRAWAQGDDWHAKPARRPRPAIRGPRVLVPGPIDAVGALRKFFRP